MSRILTIDGTQVALVQGYYEENNSLFLSSIVLSGKKKGSPFVDFTEYIPDIHLNEDEIIVPLHKMLGSSYDAFKERFVEEEICEVHRNAAISKMVKLKSNWRDLLKNWSPV